MCCDSQQLLYTSHSVICSECGTETLTVSPAIQTFAQNLNTSIVVTPYCRKQRFVTMLRKLLCVDTGPPVSDKVWKILASSAPFKNSDEIISCLKNSSLTAKHYTSLHVFARAFMQNYKPLVCTLHPLEIESVLTQEFDNVLFDWQRTHTSDSFFSYAWLLETFLKKLHIFDSYKAFLKTLVCPIRRKKYEERWRLHHTSSERFATVPA